MNPIIEELADETIKIVDIGAGGNDAPIYQALLHEFTCEITAFDPKGDWGRKNIIGDGSVKTFYHCDPACNSSCYKPYAKLIDCFQGVRMDVLNTEQVSTDRLDDLELGDIDYLRMDIQGSELAAINGGTELIKNIMIVHTEVCFIPLYQKQPLFAEIDLRLRELDFWFLRFPTMPGRRALKPFIASNGLSQDIWNDAVYVRPLKDLLKYEPLKLLKMALILDLVYNAFDYAYWPVGCYEYKTRKGLLEKYRRYLEGRERKS